MSGVSHVDVLIVADAGDPHCAAVCVRLESLNAAVLRLNLSDLLSTPLISHVGALDIGQAAGWSRVDSATTVWWFRAGSARSPEGTASDEQQLIADEAPAVLIGAFRAAGVRWVDDPDAVRQAEWKLGQLSAAAALGVATPAWTVTNDAAGAGQLADGHPVVAKPLSAGRGIAPFTAELSPEDLADPGVLATLIQRRVDAAADLRVVVIAGQSWVWRRPREAGMVDWRSADPDGRGFTQLPAQVWDEPSRLTSALGLTMSVQDWLEADSGPVFLEANPQGSWLFLDAAEQQVAPALAAHLRDERRETPGSWPRPRHRVFYDFLTKGKAPNNDGMKAPRFLPPIWADEVAAVPGALDAARSARQTAEDAAKSAEDKASRLVQVALVLLTVGLALGSYQLTFALQRSWPWLFSLVPVAGSLCCLAVAALEGLLVDRVGFYYTPSAKDLAGLGQRTPEAMLLIQEERGRRLANWSAENKHTDLMQARAWFTRGLAMLLLAGLVAGICLAVHSSAAHAGPSSDHTSPAAQHRPAPKPSASPSTTPSLSPTHS